MPIYVIERNYAEQMEINAEIAQELAVANASSSVRWLYSFLSADKRKTYCLYEADSIDAIRIAAARAGLPADVITEVTDRVTPDGALTPI